ncbi:MAG: DUF2785 domain-containing protein [bacterium]|nr:DUF2785 domain-containing protein [bacterium]
MTTYDKHFWQSITDRSYAVPDDPSPSALLPVLIDLLASTDSQLRDEYGFTTLMHWVIREPQYTPAELRQMRDRLLEGMRVGIGEMATDTVFQRSFSALALGLVVYQDNETHFLTAEEVKALLEVTLDYLKDERDLRGYVEGRGWAHSLAHGADLLRHLSRSPHLDGGDLLRILTAISDKMLEPTRTVYIHDEDERLALAVGEILKRDLLNETVLKGWLNEFHEWHTQHIGGEFDVVVHATYQNIRHLLSSLYFRVLRLDHTPPTTEALKDDLLSAVRRFSL